MDLFVFALVGIYLVATFVISALIIRFKPDSRPARKLQKSWYAFPALPVFLALAFFGGTAGRAFKNLASAPRKLFELLSGRPVQRKKRGYFKY